MKDNDNGRRVAPAQLRASVSRLAAKSYILVLDDNPTDAQWLAVKLRLVVGRDVRIEQSQALGGSLVAIERRPPAILFLDDFLPPRETALTTMPLIRRIGYAGPIIVFSGVMTSRRAHLLLAAGACDAVAKDDLDSERIAVALDRALG